MALNYATAIPTDERGNVMQEFPSPVPALATTAAVTALSSVFTLNNNTTSIEVAAPNSAVVIRWIPVGAANTSVVSSYAAAVNFDHVIPAGTYRRFVVPRETQGIAGPALANSVHGLYQRLAAVPTTAAVSSVLVTEY